MSCGCGGGSVNRTIAEVREEAAKAQQRADEQRADQLTASATNAKDNASSGS
jgi:hypothetical protein